MVDRFAVVRMQGTDQAGEIDPFQFAKPEELPPVVGRPDFVTRNIPSPKAESCGMRCQIQALVALAEVGGQQGRAARGFRPTST